LGGFYLDILKDRLYTAGKDTRARRAAQNALYHITHSLTRLMAPVLSFTGEEVHATLTGNTGGSVFFHAWHALPEQKEESALINRWEQIRCYRAQVLKELENARSAGQIGSSLQAEVILHAKPETHALLSSLGDDLKFILITSRVELVASDEDKTMVVASGHQKCDRCWHYREDVGTDPQHPQICGRCISNLYGEGEAREHA